MFVTTAAEPMAVAPAGAKKLLLEAYARSDGGDVTTPEGFSAVIVKGADLLNGAARIILNADRNDAGGWIVRSTRMIHASPGIPPSTMPGAPGGPGAAVGQNLPGWPGGPGAPKAPAGGMSPGAPRGVGMPSAPNGQNLPGWPGGPGFPGGGAGPGGFGGGGPGGPRR